MRRNVPKYMIATLVITGVYLSIEIPFSILLVRILGGVATEADIDAVEKFGRILTGFAVALAYVGLRTYPKYHEWGFSFYESTKAAIIRIIPIVALVYFGLHLYGEARGMFSTGDQRKEAFISNLARRTIAEDGMPNNPASHDPTWLASVSGLPAFASAERLVEMSGKDLRELSRREAVRSIGSVSAAAEKFSSDLEENLSSAYSRFSNSVAGFDNVIATREDRAEREWNDYRDRLRRHFGKSVPRPGTGYHSRVIKELRSEGLAVSGNFRLDDKAGFKLAVMRKITLEAGKSFRTGLVSSLGEDTKLTPSSTKADFYADPAVQRTIRESFDDIKIARSVKLLPGMDESVFAASVYPALIESASVRIFETATMYARGFTSRSSRQVGEGAFKAATLPATALLLSLSGALFHMYKFSSYLMLIFGSSIRSKIFASKPATHAFGVGVLALAVVGMKAVTPHDVAVIDNHDGGIYGEIISAAVSLQPGMFLIGDAMAAVGPWQVIGGTLPEPRLAAVEVGGDGISNETVGSLIPVPGTKPVEIAAAEEFVAPIPVPRPE